MLKKESFFSFEKNPKMALEILNLLIDVVYGLKPNDDMEQTPEAIMTRQNICIKVKGVCENFTKQVRSNPKLIEILYQNSLFKRIVIEPIEQRILFKEFYEATKCFNDYLISFNKYPTDVDQLIQLQSAFSIAISPEILDQIQPYWMSYFNQPALYFLEFYQRIAFQVYAQPHYESIFSNDLINLIRTIEKHNQYFDIKEEVSVCFNFEMAINNCILFIGFFFLPQCKNAKQKTKCLFNVTNRMNFFENIFPL